MFLECLIFLYLNISKIVLNYNIVLFLSRFFLFGSILWYVFSEGELLRFSLDYLDWIISWNLCLYKSCLGKSFIIKCQTMFFSFRLFYRWIRAVLSNLHPYKLAMLAEVDVACSPTHLKERWVKAEWVI